MREWKPTNGNRALAVSDFDRVVIPPNAATTTTDALAEADFSTMLDSRQATNHRALDSGFASGSHSGETRVFRGRGQRGRDGASLSDLLACDCHDFIVIIVNTPWRGRGRGSTAIVPSADDHNSRKGKKRENGDEHEKRHWKARGGPRNFRDGAGSGEARE